MRPRLPRRLALASAAAVLAASSLGATTVLAGLGGYDDDDNFGTTCVGAGSPRTTLTSTVDIANAGFYYVAWRTGGGSPKLISGKVRYLSIGNDQVFTATTRLSGPWIFGIVEVSTQFSDYVTCTPS